MMFHHPHNCCVSGQAPMPCTLYVANQPNPGYGLQYTCPQLYWQCACEGGTLSMQTRVDGVWTDVTPWTPSGNTWSPTRLQVLASSGFRLKCTRSTGVSYSNAVSAIPQEGNCLKGTGALGQFTATFAVTYQHSTNGSTIDFSDSATLVVAHPGRLSYQRVWLDWYDGHAMGDGLPPRLDPTKLDKRQLCFVVTAEDGTELSTVYPVPMYRRFWNFTLNTENCRVLCDGSVGVTDYLQRDWTPWPPPGSGIVGLGGTSFMRFRVPSEASTAWYQFTMQPVTPGASPWGWGVVSSP